MSMSFIRARNVIALLKDFSAAVEMTVRYIMSFRAKLTKEAKSRNLASTQENDVF